MDDITTPGAQRPEAGREPAIDAPSHPTIDPGLQAVLDRLARIEARLAAIEAAAGAQAAAPAPAAANALGEFARQAQARTQAAWAALTATGAPPQGAGPPLLAANGSIVAPPRRSALATAALVVLALLAALLAIEVAEELFDGLRHLLRKLF